MTFNGNKLPIIEISKKNPEELEQEKKIRNMFVLRKGNLTKDSNITRQNSSEDVYGIERKPSISSINNNESRYSRDNSIESQHNSHNFHHTESNGFIKSSFNAYTNENAFITPRQCISSKVSPVSSQVNCEINKADSQKGCANSMTISNRSIKIRSIVSSKAEWRNKSNGFKEFNDINSKIAKNNIIEEDGEKLSARFKPITSMGQK